MLVLSLLAYACKHKDVCIRTKEKYVREGMGTRVKGYVRHFVSHAWYPVFYYAYANAYVGAVHTRVVSWCTGTRGQNPH